MLNYEIKKILYNGKKNVLWGLGRNGIQTVLVFALQEIPVDLLCDSDNEKQGLRIFNKEIVAPEKIFENQVEYNFIITLGDKKASEEIAEILYKREVKNCLTWEDIRDMVSLADSGTDISNRISLYRIIQESYLRKLVIYGTGKEAVALKNLLKMFDVEIAYFVDDEIESACKQGEREIRPVYDLLYEREGIYKVIVMPEKRERVDILDKMGLSVGIDYDWHNQYTMNMKKTFILDPNLGYNFLSKKNIDNPPGIVSIGDGELVIALLGGSTTDGELYSFKAWGQILYEKLTQSGYSVKILNGGCGGYTTSQELVKLIRDIIPLKPDVVIDYTGANDSEYRNIEYPFVTDYQKDLVKYMAGNIKYCDSRIGDIFTEVDEKYTLGIKHNIQCFQVFADNIKMMKSICNGYGIIYLAFLQPWMGTKQNRISKYEYEFMLNCGWDSRSEALWFCENAWQLLSGYAENITSLFDEEPDVYIDYVHVTEHGNEIIAQYMYDYLIEKGIVKK